MRKDLKELADQVILAGQGLAPLVEQGVVIQSFRVEDNIVYVALVRGIEKVANIYGLKSIFIEDGIVRAEDDGICFYQYVLKKDRKRIFEELTLKGEQNCDEI